MMVMDKSHLGLGVMINRIFGDSGETSRAVATCSGKEIESVTLGKDDVLRFKLKGVGTLALRDNGQSCCESRYMRTDDDLTYYAGAVLLEIEVADGPSVDDVESHDTQFLKVTTSKGVFTMCSHVEHNGYYGGFSISASLTPLAPPPPAG